MLSGARILLTRAQENEDCPLSAQLAAWGAEVILCPLVEIQQLPYSPSILSPTRFDWVFFTSQNGVRGFFNHPFFLSHTLSTNLQIGAVGPQTAKILEQYSISCDFIPPQYSAEEAAKAFTARYPDKVNMLWPCGTLSDPLFQNILESNNRISVSRLEVYRTIRKEVLEKPLLQKILEKPVDVIVFTSSSAVEAFFQLQLHQCLQISPALPQLACIGPSTAETLENFGFSFQIMPSSSTFPALANAIRNAFR